MSRTNISFTCGLRSNSRAPTRESRCAVAFAVLPTQLPSSISLNLIQLHQHSLFLPLENFISVQHHQRTNRTRSRKMSSDSDTSEPLTLADVAFSAVAGRVARRKRSIQQTLITTFLTNAPKHEYGDDIDWDTDSETYSNDGHVYRTNPAIDSDQTRDWEQEGALHRNTESSYLDPDWIFKCIGPHMRMSKVIYDWCKPAELKRFVCDRLLTDPYPQGLTLKYFYIQALEKDDREWRFRFMDLPPEMRLMVYRNLLLHENPWLPLQSTFNVHSLSKTYPAILQTCRQIYDEAYSVLYDENMFQVTFKAAGGDTGHGAPRQALVHRKEVSRPLLSL